MSEKRKPVEKEIHKQLPAAKRPKVDDNKHDEVKERLAALTLENNETFTQVIEQGEDSDDSTITYVADSIITTEFRKDVMERLCEDGGPMNDKAWDDWLHFIYEHTQDEVKTWKVFVIPLHRVMVKGVNVSATYSWNSYDF